MSTIIPGCSPKDGDQEAEEAELCEPQVRAGAALQRQGDGGLRARHRTQPAGTQHRARQGRQVCGNDYLLDKGCSHTYSSTIPYLD